jgi:spore cortex biosynthesis protein YabQ
MIKMDNTIAMQLYSLLIFTISGIAIGVFFDIFRILRRSFKTSDIITYIEDILFWICSGSLFVYVLFKYNNGEIRNYVVIGLLLGIFFYFTTVSKYFIKISVTIVIFIKTIIIKILKIVVYPLKIILKSVRKILKPFSFIVINIKKWKITKKGKKSIRNEGI